MRERGRGRIQKVQVSGTQQRGRCARRPNQEQGRATRETQGQTGEKAAFPRGLQDKGPVSVSCCSEPSAGVTRGERGEARAPGSESPRKKKSYIGAVGGGGPQERQKVIKLNSFLFFFCMCVYFCERVYTCTYRGQSSTPGCLPQSLSTFNTYIFLKTLFLFYVWGGFNHICICVHHACPVCLEARREC